MQTASARDAAAGVGRRGGARWGAAGRGEAQWGTAKHGEARRGAARHVSKAQPDLQAVGFCDTLAAGSGRPPGSLMAARRRDVDGAWLS